MAIAPDLLSRRGGTPPSPDSARKLIAGLDPDTVTRDLDATVAYLKGVKAARAGRVGVIGFCAAVIGDNIGFAIGHFGGRPLVERFGHYVFLTPERLDKATRFFEHHGGKIIVVARFIEGLRQANGIVAGISGLHWAKFVAFNALGAALWVAVWTTIGYVSGDHIDTIYAENDMDPLTEHEYPDDWDREGSDDEGLALGGSTGIDVAGRPMAFVMFERGDVEQRVVHNEEHVQARKAERERQALARKYAEYAQGTDTPITFDQYVEVMRQLAG